MESEKKKYVTPEAEITEFDAEDIIVTSGNELPFEPV